MTLQRKTWLVQGWYLVQDASCLKIGHRNWILPHDPDEFNIVLKTSESLYDIWIFEKTIYSCDENKNPVKIIPWYIHILLDAFEWNIYSEIWRQEGCLLGEILSDKSMHAAMSQVTLAFQNSRVSKYYD